MEQNRNILIRKYKAKLYLSIEVLPEFLFKNGYSNCHTKKPLHPHWSISATRISHVLAEDKKNVTTLDTDATDVHQKPVMATESHGEG